MAKKVPKRPVCVRLQRSTGHIADVVIWTRYYSSVTNALRRGVELAILTGYPGDALEVSSSVFGFLIATIKLTVNAKSIANLKIEFHVANQIDTERRLHSKAKL